MQDVKRGERYIITHHGDPIAELVPAQPETKRERFKDAARQMLAFMARGIPAEVDIKAAIEEGRD